MSTTRLNLCVGATEQHRPFCLPVDFITQTAAVLAKKRVGKSYTCMVIGEEMVAAGLPFVALDPTGAWWGLRASADGTGPGLPVAILGGAHADVLLEPTMGTAIADLVVDAPGWYVLDLSYFESNAAQDRFAYDFAIRLFRRKAKAPSPLHLFVDEADAFIPQRPLPGQQRMLGAFEALVRRGGIHGIGITMITQRPAVLNKNVLSQIELLIVLQMTAPQDRAVIEEWVRGNGTKAESDEVLGSLASLPRGNAWVWSPTWLETLQRIAVRERTTYNSSATPLVGTALALPAHLAPVDVSAIRERLEASVEEDVADTTLLRQRVRDLERQLQERSAHRESEHVEGAVLSAADRATIAALAAQLDALGGTIVQEAQRLTSALGAGAAVGAESVPVSLSATTRANDRQNQREAQAPRTENTRRPERQQRMLNTLAEFETFGVRQLDKRLLAILTNQSPLSSAYTTHLRTLRIAGVILQDSNQVSLTLIGQHAAHAPDQPRSLEALHEAWMHKVSSAQARMLQVLITAYPTPIARDELARQSRQSPTSSAFDTNIRELRTFGVLEMTTTTDTKHYRATLLMFPPALVKGNKVYAKA